MSGKNDEGGLQDEGAITLPTLMAAISKMASSFILLLLLLHPVGIVAVLHYAQIITKDIIILYCFVYVDFCWNKIIFRDQCNNVRCLDIYIELWSLDKEAWRLVSDSALSGS